MKTIATSSIGSESNAPSEAERVEKPPVATVVNEWLSASHSVIPAAQNAISASAVSAT